MIPFSRADRVGGLVQKVLSDLLQKEIRDPRLIMTTISGVKMSKDLKFARVYFTILGGDEHKKVDAISGFNSAVGFIKRCLARELKLRYMPDLKFYYDESYDHGSHIDRLLKSISEE